MSWVRTVAAFGVLVCLTLAPPAAAKSMWNSNKLYTECSRSGPRCASYLAAVVDTANEAALIATQKLAICLPPKAKVEKLRKVVLKELEVQPQARASSAASVALRALKRKWPCPTHFGTD
ncbi:Rap1a/Tai family immunity protein [Nordella sp. HKS 07]|uniref:Rap1a/Tai family immunity protein n=1 Tax=Nordella sp. HKS 07 TaxID=2712222 RepID=UPI00352E81C9